MPRLNVLKTYKLFINGQFPRSESGRYYELRDKNKKTIANVCLGSRKDLRDAVVAARGAFPVWHGKTAYNRGQILYRIAEMLEGRRSQFAEELILQGISKSAAVAELNVAIDRLVYYTGWCDKYQSVFSSVNPVSSPHHNFSVPEPMGVVSVIAPEQNSFSGLVSVIAPIIAGGNTCVVLASEKQPLSAITFAEVLATSDLPAGVVNIITGKSEELHQHFSSHMDINTIIYCRDDKEEQKTIEENCSLNVKRFFHWNKDWQKEDSQGPYLILDLQEIKTTWHPVESGGGGGVKY